MSVLHRSCLSKNNRQIIGKQITNEKKQSKMNDLRNSYKNSMK